MLNTKFVFPSDADAQERILNLKRIKDAKKVLRKTFSEEEIKALESLIEAISIIKLIDHS